MQLVQLVKFGDTKASILQAINKANESAGTSTGYKELTSQYVYVWHLEAGIYKWTYQGQKYLYYNGSSNDNPIEIGSSFNDDLFIEITSGKLLSLGSGEKLFKNFKLEIGNTAGLREVYWGRTFVDSGEIHSKSLDNIPDEPAQNGGGIPVLTTQTVNLADLEAGIYRWEYSIYNAEEDGYDTTKTLLAGDSTCMLYSNPVFLHVHKVGNEVTFEAIDNEDYDYDETHRVIYYGGMHLEDGDGYWNRRDLDLIPEEYIDTTQLIKRTKITLSELRSYLFNYNINFGKQVQLVYKGTVDDIISICNEIGTLTIMNRNSLNKGGGYTEANESSLSGRRYSFNISASVASFSYYYWDFDFAVTNIGTTQTVQITDTDFDIYIIG